jgi:hypothetical protein
MLQRGKTVEQIAKQAKSIQGKRRRTMKDPPTKPHHLNDAITNRSKLKAIQAVMDLSTLQQPEEGTDLNGAYSSTLLVHMTNVERTKKNGGGTGANDKSNAVTDKMAFNVVAPGGAKALRHAAGALLQAAEAVDNNNTTSAASHIEVSEQVSLIMDNKQFDKHKTQTIRKKAKVVNEKDTHDNLEKSGALRRRKRKDY